MGRPCRCNSNRNSNPTGSPDQAIVRPAFTRRIFMRKTVFRAIAIAAVLSPPVAFTQSGKTKPTTATYITKEEVDTVNKNGQGIDRNIKVVDIGHENYSVGIIHRGKTVNGVAVPSGAAAANAAPAAGRAGGAAAPAPEPCGRQMA